MDRIQRELKAAGLDKESSVITPETLSNFDSMHYLGDEAVKKSIRAVSIEENSEVLDIGSGLGGPGRLLAYWTSCNVDALELQSDVHETAALLTERCGLSKKVKHLCGNVLEDCDNLPNDKKYNAIVSWLVFLHISDRKALFRKCFERLLPGGKMYVEDYCRVEGSPPFTARERELLAGEVYVQHELPLWTDMKVELEEQGFRLISMKEMTSVWRQFVQERKLQYSEKIERHRIIHGQEAAEALCTFYDAVHELFQGGTLGGCTYIVEKPSSAQN